MEIALSLGSNAGDRLANLKEGRDRVAAIPEVPLLAASPVYETEPVDVPARYADRSFLNAVLVVACDRPLEDFLRCLHKIERDLGRPARHDPNAPRPLDLDIVYAGELRVSTPDLTVPHPRWSQRRFVVQPLADVRPDAVLPGERRTVRQVLLSLPVRPNVVLYPRQW